MYGSLQQYKTYEIWQNTTSNHICWLPFTTNDIITLIHEVWMCKYWIHTCTNNLYFELYFNPQISYISLMVCKKTYFKIIFGAPLMASEAQNLFKENCRPSVNFTNVLCPAYTLVDPKTVKRCWQLDWILTLLGAAGIKVACKHVGEINP